MTLTEAFNRNYEKMVKGNQHD